MKRRLLTCAIAVASAMVAGAQTNVMDINTKKAGAKIQDTMYGLFFEDINYAADGGLYGELVKNRSFEFPQNYMGWQVFGNVTLKNDGPFERCPHYVELKAPNHGDRRTGLQNEGYFGIGVVKGEDYRFSVWAKAPKGKATIRVQLIDQYSMGEHQEFVEKTLDITSTDWKKYEIVMKAPITHKKANLRIFLKGGNPVSLEHVSLFPVNTFKNRQNGLRRDVAQALADASLVDVSWRVLTLRHATSGRTPSDRWRTARSTRTVGSTRLTIATIPTIIRATDWDSSSSSSSLRTLAQSLCLCSTWVWPASSRTGTRKVLTCLWTSSTRISRTASTSSSLPMAMLIPHGERSVPRWDIPNHST